MSSSLLKIPKQSLEKFNEFLWGSTENVFCAEEIIKLHLNGGADPRTIIITNGATYVFRTRNFNKIELSNKFTVLSISKITYNEPNILNIYYDDNSLSMKTDDALQIGRLLIAQYAMISYQVPSVFPLQVESTPMGSLTYTQIKTRPQSLLQTRLIVFAHYYDTQFALKNVRLFKDWDRVHSGNFVLDSTFQLNVAAKAVAHSIAYDADLHSLVLNNFAPESLSVFIGTLFANSAKLYKIQMENYIEPISTDFTFASNEDSQIAQITFKNCHAQIILAFFHALSSFNGRFRHLSINGTSFQTEDLSDIFQCIQTMPCFMKLQVFRLEGLKIEQFPTEDYKNVVGKLRYLQTLGMNQMPFDGFDALKLMCESAQNPKHLEITAMKFNTDSEITVPDSITYADFTKSTFTPTSFRALMNKFYSVQRHHPLYLGLNSIQGSTISSLFGAIADMNPQPNTIELVLSENELTPDDISSVLKFVKTQANLKFLDLSLSIVNDREPEKCLQILADFLKEDPVEGIAIKSNKEKPIKAALMNFIPKLNGVAGIHSLRMNDMQLSDEGISLLIELCKTLPDLKEVDFDGIDATSAGELNRLYYGLIEIPTLTAINSPKADLAFLNISKEAMPSDVRQMLVSLKQKKLPKTLVQRLHDYDLIDVDRVDGEEPEHMNLNEMLVLIEPASISTKGRTSSYHGKGRNRTLDELTTLMESMVQLMKGEQPTKNVDPVNIAHVIMSQLSTSKKALQLAQETVQEQIIEQADDE